MEDGGAVVCTERSILPEKKPERAFSPRLWNRDVTHQLPGTTDRVADFGL
jgi:hypothetical protein